MRTICLLLCAAAAVYAFALQFARLNEHFDKARPKTIQGVVVHNGMRYNPMPINVIEFETRNGQKLSVDVLETTAYGFAEGDQITVVEKPGLLGKTWYEEATFHTYLENSRTFQGAVATALLLVIVGVWARAALRSGRRIVGVATLAVGLLTGLELFYALP